MQLSEALALAAMVDEAARIELVAVGRFKPLLEFTPRDEWAISASIDRRALRVYWSADELREVLEELDRPAPTGSKPAAARPTVREDQPLLF